MRNFPEKPSASRTRTTQFSSLTYGVLAWAIAVLAGSATAQVGIECFSPLDPLPLNRVLVIGRASYAQTSSSSLVLKDGIGRPGLIVEVRTSAALSGSAATLGIPSSPPRQIDVRGLFGFFYSFYSEQAESRVQLEAAAPVAGDYNCAVTTSQGHGNAVLQFPAGGWPSVPGFANFDALQNADASKDIVIQWDPVILCLPERPLKTLT